MKLWGLFDFLQNFLQPRVRPANVWNNPFTCPLPVLDVLELERLHIVNSDIHIIPRGTILPHAVNIRGLSSTYTNIEEDLCLVLARDPDCCDLTLVNFIAGHDQRCSRGLDPGAPCEGLPE
jgi:hypothetical protein